VLSTGYTYLDPFIAVIGLGVIVLICRWVFSTDHRAAPPAPPERPDYGLLEAVTVVRTREDADMLRSVLRDAGIRASVTDTTDGFAVLVFRADVSAARDLVRSA
jgi:cytochrome oxidase assembly protein ShyY1